MSDEPEIVPSFILTEEARNLIFVFAIYKEVWFCRISVCFMVKLDSDTEKSRITARVSGIRIRYDKNAKESHL